MKNRKTRHKPLPPAAEQKIVELVRERNAGGEVTLVLSLVALAAFFFTLAYRFWRG